MKVRLHSSAWGWKNEFGKSGASFNLLGVMDAGQGGDRLAIGNGANGSAAAFGGHANPNAQPMQTQGAAQPVNNGNSFGGQPQAQSGAPAQSANPFAQQTSANANPFAAQA